MQENILKETVEYLIYTITCAFHPSMFKCAGSFFIVVFSFAFDISQGKNLLALFVLVLLDFCTGIAAAKYNNVPIRSSKIKHTAIKLTAYFTVIAGAHLAESGLIDYLTFLDETVTAFFLLTELISLIENAGKMGIDTPKGFINNLLDYKKKL